MRSKGFTLIELLAVIVILAIIALIAIPIVIKIIDTTKEGARVRSAELYMDTVKLSVTKASMDPEFPQGEITCEVFANNLSEKLPDGYNVDEYDSDDLLCYQDDIRKPVKVDIKGEVPLSGQIKFDKGKIVEDGTWIEMPNKSYYEYENNRLVKITEDEITSIVNKSRLPEEYQEVEYIMSTTDSLISIPYTLNMLNKVVEMEVSLSFRNLNNQDTYIMYLSEGSANLYACAMLAKGSSNTVYAYNKGATNTYGETAIIDKKYKLKAVWDDIEHKRYYYVNDVLQGTENLQLASDRVNVAYLSFGTASQTNWVSYYNDGIYVKVDGKTIFDLVPCYRKSDGEVGLYDLIGNNFYESSGTGKFIPIEKINLPKGYKQVEYIESTGTQYIDTKFTPNQDTRVVIDYQFTGTSSADCAWIFGSRVNYTSRAFAVMGDFNGNTSTFINYNNTYKLGPARDRIRHILDFHKNGVKQDGKTIATFTYTQFNGYGDMRIMTIGGTTSNSRTKMKLYSCKIYDNGILVRDFIPCYTTKAVVDVDGIEHLSGIAGLYELVNDEFYASKGSDEFLINQDAN